VEQEVIEPFVVKKLYHAYLMQEKSAYLMFENWQGGKNHGR